MSVSYGNDLLTTDESTYRRQHEEDLPRVKELEEANGALNLELRKLKSEQQSVAQSLETLKQKKSSLVEEAVSILQSIFMVP